MASMASMASMAQLINLSLVMGSFSEGIDQPQFSINLGGGWLNEVRCNHARQVRIGSIESPGEPSGSTRLFTEHSAFLNMTDPDPLRHGSIEYQFPTFASCTTNMDCEALCSAPANAFAGGPNACYCIDGECVSHHQTRTTALIGAFHSCQDNYDPANPLYSLIREGILNRDRVDIANCTEGNLGAAEADFYIANSLMNGGTSQQNAQRLTEAYDWLINQKGVLLISESWAPSRNEQSVSGGGNRRPMSYRAPLADYYARRYGAIIVQASGNLDPNFGAGVYCDGFNTLCVGGARLQSRFPWSFSDWSPDPGTETEDPGIQAASGTYRALRLHKPDVVAPSRGLNVPAFEAIYDPTSAGRQNYPDTADTASNVFQDYWQVGGGEGSSFAAPVVTGIIAQVLHSYGSHLTGAEVRAIINAGSPHHPRFPNLDPSACQPGPTFAYPASRSTSASPPDAQNCDYAFGVGPLSPWAFQNVGIALSTNFCPGSGGGSGGGGGSSPTCPFGDSCNPEAAFRGRAVVTPDVHHMTGLPLEALPSDPTRRIRRLSGPRRGGQNGFAVRAAVSFDRCVAAPPSALIEGFAAGLTREDRDYRSLIDFDLAVFAWNQGDAVETELLRVGSPDETNEVIWYSTLQSWDFYEVVVVEPANYTPCPSSFNYQNETGEALGWAEIHFARAISPINGP